MPRRGAGRTVAPLLGVVVLLGSAVARADSPEPDAWLGWDKAAHFGASAAIATAGYGQASLVFEGYGPRVAVGAGLALGVGIGKEALDAAGLGHASWKDLAWDVLGTAVGVGLALSFDRVLGRL